MPESGPPSLTLSWSSPPAGRHCPHTCVQLWRAVPVHTHCTIKRRELKGGRLSQQIHSRSIKHLSHKGMGGRDKKEGMNDTSECWKYSTSSDLTLKVCVDQILFNTPREQAHVDFLVQSSYDGALLVRLSKSAVALCNPPIAHRNRGEMSWYFYL